MQVYQQNYARNFMKGTMIQYFRRVSHHTITFIFKKMLIVGVSSKGCIERFGSSLLSGKFSIYTVTCFVRLRRAQVYQCQM